MKRRSFVKSALIATSAGSIIPMAGKTAFKNTIKRETRLFYELRTYHLDNDVQATLVKDYFQHAAIPALNSLGNKPVGIFTEMKPEGTASIFVIIPYTSLDDFMKSGEKLLKDDAYQKAANNYLNAPATAPAYNRIESSLLYAFEHMPGIAIPEKKPRIFELRRYESPSETAGQKKIEMFNDAGEIDIFKNDGLRPVFYGQTIIGPMRPNLTYMLTFDDMEAHDKYWKIFGSDAEWKKISSMLEYADAKLISRITSTLFGSGRIFADLEAFGLIKNIDDEVECRHKK